MRLGPRARLVLPLGAGLLSTLLVGPLFVLGIAGAGQTPLERLSSGFTGDAPAASWAAALGTALLLCAGLGATAVLASSWARDIGRLAARVGAAAGRESLMGEALTFAETAQASAAAEDLLQRGTDEQLATFLAVEQEDEARRARTQFLASVGHDLRSPLNSILGFSELLLRGLDGEVGQEERAALGTIQQQGRSLLRLLNEILDTARCDAGRMTVEPEPMMPADLVRLAVEELRRALPQGAAGSDPGPAVTTELQAGLTSVVADPVRLPQAIAHLLAHAHAATPVGSEPLRLGVSDRQAQGARQLVIEVSHRGDPVGDDWDRTPFAIHRLHPGDLGLALPLAVRLVELHGGTITVASEKDAAGSFARYRIAVPAGPRKERLAQVRLRSLTPVRGALLEKTSRGKKSSSGGGDGGFGGHNGT